MATGQDTDRLWSLADVASFLDVSRRTLHRWRVLGFGPPAFKIGHQLRYHPDEVKAWVETQRR